MATSRDLLHSDRYTYSIGFRRASHVLRYCFLLCAMSIVATTGFGQAIDESLKAKTGSIHLLFMDNGQQLVDARLKLVGVFDEKFLIDDLRSPAVINLLNLSDLQQQKLEEIAGRVTLLRAQVQDAARESASLGLFSADDAPFQLSEYQELAKASDGLFTKQQVEIAQHLVYRKNIALKSADVTLKQKAVASGVPPHRIAQFSQATIDARSSIRQLEREVRDSLLDGLKKNSSHGSFLNVDVVATEDDSFLPKLECIRDIKVISVNERSIVAAFLQTASSWRIALDGGLQRYPEPFGQPLESLRMLLQQRHYSDYSFNDMQVDFLRTPNVSARKKLMEKREAIMRQFADGSVDFDQTNQKLMEILREFELANITDLLSILDPAALKQLQLTLRRRLLSIGVLAIPENLKAGSETGSRDALVELQELLEQEAKRVDDELREIELTYWNTLAGIFDGGKLGEDLDFTVLSNIAEEGKPLISVMVR